MVPIKPQISENLMEVRSPTFYVHLRPIFKKRNIKIVGFIKRDSGGNTCRGLFFAEEWHTFGDLSKYLHEINKGHVTGTYEFNIYTLISCYSPQKTQFQQHGSPTQFRENVTIHRHSALTTFH